MIEAAPTVEVQLQVHGQGVAVQLPNGQLRAWESAGDRLAGVWQRVWPAGLTQIAIANEEYSAVAASAALWS